MKKTWLNYGIAVACLSVLVSGQFTHAAETPFVKSSTSFFTESEVFSKESNLLIDNTQEIDTTLLHFENILAVPHSVATALKKLSETLAVIKQMIVIAKMVPQTREQAQKLETNLDAIKQPVADAAEKSVKLDEAVEPVRKATDKAESAAEMALDYENKSRTAALAYIDLIEKLVPCSESKPAIEPQGIKILDSSTATFHKLDEGMKKVNQAYATTVAAPEKALKATIVELTEQIKQLEEILKSVDGLQNQLHPLNDVLAELKKVLDQSVGISFEYPCGSKMCSQKTPYPCGTKTCHKLGAPYPCGVKFCDKEVPFPCGVKMCTEKLSISLSTVINGADAIEHKIESLLSSTAWQALKTLGVKKYVEQLQKQADSLTKPLLGKLHLDISTKLPDLNFKLNTATLSTAVQQLAQISEALTQLGKAVDMSNPVFAPEFAKLTLLDKDLLGLLSVSGCQGAQIKTAPVMPKRINWKKLGFKL